MLYRIKCALAAFKKTKRYPGKAKTMDTAETKQLESVLTVHLETEAITWAAPLNAGEDYMCAWQDFIAWMDSGAVNEQGIFLLEWSGGWTGIRRGSIRYFTILKREVAP